MEWYPTEVEEPQNLHLLRPKCLPGNRDNLAVVASAGEAVEEVTGEVATSAIEEVVIKTTPVAEETRTPEAETLTPVEAIKPIKTEVVTTIIHKKVLTVQVVTTTDTIVTEAIKEVLMTIEVVLALTEEVLLATIEEVVLATTEEAVLVAIEEAVLAMIIEVVMAMIIEVVMATTIVAVTKMTIGVTMEAIEVVVEAATMTDEVAEVVIVLKIFNSRNALKLMILFKLQKPPMPINTSKRSSTTNSILREMTIGIREAVEDRTIIEEVEVDTVNLRSIYNRHYTINFIIFLH